MFTLIGLLGLDIKRRQMSTCSRRIKVKSVAITQALRDARALIKEWNGSELHPNPSYKQLVGFTIRMLDNMIGGQLESNGVIRMATEETIEVKDDRKPDGKTTRKRQEKTTQYQLQFPGSGDDDLTALQRVDMLKKLEI